VSCVSCGMHAVSCSWLGQQLQHKSGRWADPMCAVRGWQQEDACVSEITLTRPANVRCCLLACLPACLPACRCCTAAASLSPPHSDT
jgi:hypothetical protein